MKLNWCNQIKTPFLAAGILSEHSNTPISIALFSVHTKYYVNYMCAVWVKNSGIICI